VSRESARRPSFTVRVLRVVAFAALVGILVVAAANAITVGSTRGNVHTVAQIA